MSNLCISNARLKNEGTRQPKATQTLKPRASQPTTKIYEPRTAVIDKRSTTTSKPSRTGVCTKQNLNAQSTIKAKEKVSAINQRGEKTEEQSNKRVTLYKAPHAGTAITSRANGELTGSTKVSEHIHAFLYI